MNAILTLLIALAYGLLGLHWLRLQERVRAGCYLALAFVFLTAFVIATDGGISEEVVAQTVAVQSSA